MKLTLQFGPAVITFEADTLPHDWKDPTSFYPLFEVSNDTPSSLTVIVHETPAPVSDQAISVGEYNGNWHLFRQGDQWRLDIRDPASMQPKQIVFFDEMWSHAAVHLLPRTYALPDYMRHGWILIDVVEPLVQWWLTYWMAQHQKGLIFHGSAMGFGDQAMAFVGASGAGKSTIAGWGKKEGAQILSDERILVWNDGTQWVVSGTPWHGDLHELSPVTLPLTRISMLAKSEGNKFIPLRPAFFAREVLQEAFLPLWNYEAMSKILNLAGQLALDIPAGHLECRNNPDVIRYLRSLLDPDALVRL